MSFVYLLVSSDNATYVGATVDIERRLRQHNKEIKGGAHATDAKVNKGRDMGMRLSRSRVPRLASRPPI